MFTFCVNFWYNIRRGLGYFHCDISDPGPKSRMSGFFNPASEFGMKPYLWYFGPRNLMVAQPENRDVPETSGFFNPGLESGMKPNPRYFACE